MVKAPVPDILKLSRYVQLSVLLSLISQWANPIGCFSQPATSDSDNSPNGVHQLKIQKYDADIQSETRIRRPMAASQTDNAPMSGMAASSLLNGKTEAGSDPDSLKGDNPQLDQNGRSFKLKTQTLNGTADDTSTPTLDVPLTSVKLLAKYQIELVVDRSNSMRRRDCPGGLSRWAWCGQQAHGLAKAIAPFVPNGFTMTAFAWQFDVYKNCSPQNISELFDRPNFEFGTRLAEALSSRLDNYLAQPSASTKPLLIAVITDGVPFPPPEQNMVCDVIIKATKRMKEKSEISVVFFQVGGRDLKGRDYLHFLDHDLVRNGAKFDIVKSIAFEDLLSDGLPNSLANSAQRVAKLAR
jgi:hypothetical protein